MAQGMDILHLFPELVAIGQPQLQAYCNQWLRRGLIHPCCPEVASVGVSILCGLSASSSRSFAVPTCRSTVDKPANRSARSGVPCMSVANSR